jgi:nitronate monooxygenase
MMTNRLGSKAWTENRLTSRLGLQYPIIQGPLGGLSSQRLTAAVSNYGGLGSFGAHGLEPEAIRKVIREIKDLTSKPFAMNLWVSMEDEGAFTSAEEGFHRSLAPLAKHIESVEGAKPSYRPYKPIRFEDQVQVLLDEGISGFSFIYGIPSKQILDEFRRQGVVLIGTATTVDEAIALERAGVDVIAASGFEAGGHRGSFLQPSEDSLTGTMALVPQVVDAVTLPVVAAGGIGDARGIMAAFALGAEGVQMGTAFLACEESGASTHHRHAMLFSAGKRSRPPLRVGSREGLPAESETGFWMNSIARTPRSFHTPFNALSSGICRYQPRGRGELIFSLSGQDRAPTYHGVQTCIRYSTRL